MRGLAPRIHDLLCCQDVDGRDKPGHDGTPRESRYSSGPGFFR